MAEIIAICGKIASGKTYYTRNILLPTLQPAVVLSADALMTTLFPDPLGDAYDVFSRRAMAYLHRQAAELVSTGVTVILDWGFWTSADRAETNAYYSALNIPCSWHYLNIDNATWLKHIQSRNDAVTAGTTTDYFIDEGLLAKLNSRFEAPDPSEMDVIVHVE